MGDTDKKQIRHPVPLTPEQDEALDVMVGAVQKKLGGVKVHRSDVTLLALREYGRKIKVPFPER